jgi:hypothetical protein
MSLERDLDRWLGGELDREALEAHHPEAAGIVALHDRLLDLGSTSVPDDGSWEQLRAALPSRSAVVALRPRRRAARLVALVAAAILLTASVAAAAVPQVRDGIRQLLGHGGTEDTYVPVSSGPLVGTPAPHGDDGSMSGTGHEGQDSGGSGDGGGGDSSNSGDGGSETSGSGDTGSGSGSGEDGGDGGSSDGSGSGDSSGSGSGDSSGSGSGDSSGSGSGDSSGSGSGDSSGSGSGDSSGSAVDAVTD